MLIEAIATIIISAVGAIIAYLFKRLNKLEAETEARHQQDLDKLRGENTELSTEVENLREEVKKLREQAEQVPDLQRQINVLVSQLETLQEFKTKAEGWLESKDQKIENQDKQLKTQARIINKQEDTIKRQEDLIRDQAAELRGWREAAKEIGFARKQATEEAKSKDGIESEQLSEPAGYAAQVVSGSEPTSHDGTGDSASSRPGGMVRDLAVQERDSGDGLEQENVSGTPGSDPGHSDRSDPDGGVDVQPSRPGDGQEQKEDSSTKAENSPQTRQG